MCILIISYIKSKLSTVHSQNNSTNVPKLTIKIFLVDLDRSRLIGRCLWNKIRVVDGGHSSSSSSINSLIMLFSVKGCQLKVGLMRPVKLISRKFIVPWDVRVYHATCFNKQLFVFGFCSSYVLALLSAFIFLFFVQTKKNMLPAVKQLTS